MCAPPQSSDQYRKRIPACGPPIGGRRIVHARRVRNTTVRNSARLTRCRLCSAYPHRVVTFSHLLYLHGFRSSPLSAKAQQAARRVERLRAEGRPLVWWCPQLPPSPAEALETVLRGVSSWPIDRMGVIGSSLGGYYATVVAERLGCRAVVLNPAVDPARDLAGYIGEIEAWHTSERFHFRPEYVEQLKAMAPGPLSRPQRCFAIIAKGDEVLDWREMAQRYRGCPMRLLEGSDHGLSDFDEHIDAVFDFLDER